MPRLEGGATVNAVRAAMQFGLGFARGRTDEEQAQLDGLVRIVEFNPTTAQRRFLPPATEWSTSGVLVEILWDPDSVKTVAPELRIEPVTGYATNVSVEQTLPQEEQGQGFAVPGVTLEPGDMLVADAARQTVSLVRRDGRRSVCAMADLAGRGTRTVPVLPTDERRWRVRATMGFDVGRFDRDTFVGSGSADEAPKPIALSIGAVEYQPYVFDVFMPVEPESALARAGLDKNLATYQPYSAEELDELLQSVRAAGVTARLHLTQFLADAKVETTEDAGHDETTLEVTVRVRPTSDDHSITAQCSEHCPTGHLTVAVHNRRSGRAVVQGQHNDIVDDGRRFLAGLVIGLPQSRGPLQWAMVGTGTSATTMSMTSLQSPVAELQLPLERSDPVMVGGAPPEIIGPPRPEVPGRPVIGLPIEPGPILRRPVVPRRCEVKFTTDCGPGDANGLILTEVGLFAEVDDKELLMYNRVLLTNPIPKAPDVSVGFTWTLKF